MIQPRSPVRQGALVIIGRVIASACCVPGDTVSVSSASGSSPVAGLRSAGGVGFAGSLGAAGVAASLGVAVAASVAATTATAASAGAVGLSVADASAGIA